MRASESRRHFPLPTVVSNILTTRRWSVRQNGLAPAERLHTLNTTANRFWAGTILHWTAYTWHWRMNIILYKGDMRTFLVHWQQDEFQLWVNRFMSRSSVSNAGLRISKKHSVAHCCVQRPNHPAMTRPSKRIGNSWTISHIEQNSKSILSRNGSPLICSHVALVYRHYFV